MSYSSRTKRNGGLDLLTKRVEKPGTVDVGIIDAGEHDESDLTVAQIGFINEFGTEDGRIPERSFMRSTIAERKNVIRAMQRRLLRRIVAGTIDQKQALGILGDMLRGMISNKITDLREPENAPRTLAKKFPKTNPLIDTGQLRNSITFKVNE